MKVIDVWLLNSYRLPFNVQITCQLQTTLCEGQEIPDGETFFLIVLMLLDVTGLHPCNRTKSGIEMLR